MLNKIQTEAEMIAAAALKGAAIKNLGPMCDDCAFKKGTNANNEDHTASAALDCLAFGGKFNCHTDDLQNAGKACTGFLYAKQYFDSIED